MCGITGMVTWQEDVARYQADLKRMQAVLSNRGPDQQGIYQDTHCAMAHTRLAVIDVERGKQPMTRQIATETYTLVYNGELYNTPELREELRKEGAVFTTHCDTEVVLQAYLHWGAACTERFNGIFAFVVWEQQAQRLFLARDRIGVKPLFYAEIPGGLVFASEIKALLQHPAVPHTIDKHGIAQIKPHTDNMEQTIEQVRELVKDVATRQMVSDVPIGTFLSGGLDSSLLSSLANQVLKKRGEVLHTFSVDYKDNDRYFQKSHFQPNSDPDYIRAMMDYLQCQHHWTVLDTPQLAAALIPAMQARDLPGMVDVDSSLYLFCGAIKEQVTVALSGECADELFGGYPWYRDPNIRERDGFPWAQSTDYRMQFLREEFAEQIDGAAFVSQAYQETIQQADTLPEDSPLECRMRQMMLLNLDWFMQTLLDRKDRMSMANALEVRVPFCDYRIAEYLYNVPWEMKEYKGYEKGLLRAAMQDYLPEKVLWRKKSPYPKTHNPNYLQAVRAMLAAILQDPKAPLFQLVKREAIEQLLLQPSGVQWYGQLMAYPQTIAYFVQMNAWLQAYDVKIVE